MGKLLLLDLHSVALYMEKIYIWRGFAFLYCQPVGLQTTFQASSSFWWKVKILWFDVALKGIVSSELASCKG